jgi:hypothetical protein
MRSPTGSIPPVRLRPIRAALLTTALAIITLAESLSAQTELDRILVSSDIHARIEDPNDGAFTLGRDSTIFDLDGDGFGDGFAPFPAGISRDGLDITGFHLSPRRYSIDTAIIISGQPVRPNDIFFFDGFGVPQLALFGRAEGIPENARIDAVSVDPDTGDLVFSLDITATLGGVIYFPTDVIRWDGTAFSLYFNGLELFQMQPGANIDAAHVLDADRLLVSVSTPTTVPGGPGGFFVQDDDVLEVERATGNFNPLLALRDANSSWEAAGIDALWAEQAPQGGEIRIVNSFREVQESAGTVFLQVERVNGSEGVAGIFVDAISGSATEDDDFSGDVAFTALWADGESGIRSIPAVDIIDDGAEEPVEEFTVEISIFAGDATVGSPSSATIRILDNDGENLFNHGFES